mmetsp:Transcript_21844/g.25251  ORF Transcript_21844/g.25251 Transcript_21844/m.25251 type:complete len:87 (-) Transcript_21844:78-338(-)
MNQTFNPIFRPYADMRVSCKSLKEKIEAGQLPALPASEAYEGPMCLAYHTKGLYMTNCRCKHDHVEYSNDEYLDIMSWCTTNFRFA